MTVNILFGNESAKKAIHLFNKIRILKLDVATLVTTQRLVEMI